MYVVHNVKIQFGSACFDPEAQWRQGAWWAKVDDNVGSCQWPDIR